MFESNDEDYDFDQSYNLNYREHPSDNYFDAEIEAFDLTEKHRSTNDTVVFQTTQKCQEFECPSPKAVEKPLKPPQIIETTYPTDRKYAQCKNFDRSDTRNLSRNVKTVTSKFLNVLVASKQTTASQTASIKAYNKKNGTLDSYGDLFSHPKLKEKCSEFYKSHSFLTDVMKSKKMEFNTKIMLVKYLRKISEMPTGNIACWKSRNSSSE